VELYLQYLLALRGRVELNQGRWTAAAESATAVLRIHRQSITPRINALVVLGLVRARRGDPEHAPLLEEAWLRAQPTGELGRLGWVAAARAESAWLAGDTAAVDTATLDTLALAVERGWSWLAGELALWRRRAGLPVAVGLKLPRQVALELAGDAEAAATVWTELGCPYEAALALGHSEHASSVRLALDELQRYEARSAATIVMRRVRGRGMRGLPRGPRPATRSNPAQLTPRELEVLALVADGLRDSDIAERLVLSDRTVGHHVSAILGKLGVRTRAEATSRAVRMGMSAPPIS
jgi:DNA-binding CsgD family transcriptional regulator